MRRGEVTRTSAGKGTDSVFKRVGRGGVESWTREEGNVRESEKDEASCLLKARKKELSPRGTGFFLGASRNRGEKRCEQVVKVKGELGGHERCVYVLAEKTKAVVPAKVRTRGS